MMAEGGGRVKLPPIAGDPLAPPVAVMTPISPRSMTIAGPNMAGNSTTNILALRGGTPVSTGNVTPLPQSPSRTIQLPQQQMPVETALSPRRMRGMTEAFSTSSSAVMDAMNVTQKIDFSISSEALTPEKVELKLLQRKKVEEIISTAIATGSKNIYLDGFDLCIIPTSLTKQMNSNSVLSSKLQSLHLHNNCIIVLPKCIEYLTNLRELSLSSNLLMSVPEEIGNLTELERLHLTDNQLVCLPASIGRCRNLKRLFIGGNKLVTLPPDIGKLENLKWLCLDGNLLTSLPPQISNLKMLSWLSLERCSLSRLPTEIADLTNLAYLSVLDCTNIEIIPMEIGSLPKLEDLRANNKLRFPTQLVPVDSNLRDPRVIFGYLQDVIARFGLNFDHKCHWNKDELTPKCTKCGMTFTLTKRRHHCRICGRIFCNTHTANKLDIPAMGVKRVCEDCFTALDPSNPSNLYMKRLMEYEESKGIRTYGLVDGEELLPFLEKKGKLEKQLEEIEEAIKAEERTQEGFKRMVEAYQRDPTALEKAMCELADNRKKIKALIETRERVKGQLEDLQEDEEDDLE